MIRIGLQSAESVIPGINDLLAELAILGVSEFQIEGPAIYCRPAGTSSVCDDAFIVYQAVIVQPDGVGCTTWSATDFDEHSHRPQGQPVDLAAHFVAYEKCPPIVRSLLVAYAGKLLERLMGDVRLLGS